MKLITLSLFAFLTPVLAEAHISYVARDLGAYDPMVVRSSTIFSNTVSSDYGWASGTDANGGDSHKLRAFKFAMTTAGTIRILVQGQSFDRSGIPISALPLPAFSIYRGLGHESPALADHDSSMISTLWNDAAYGTGNWQGSFRGLADWKIGNDDGSSFGDLSSFTYMGNAADGTAAEFGDAPGILGDGNADGMVIHSLSLDSGFYSIFIGGGRYYDLLNTGGDTSSFGFLVTVSTIPENSTTSLLVLAFGALCQRYRRRLKGEWTPGSGGLRNARELGEGGKG